jgi:fibro-slime domain-containing protein
MFVPIGVVNEDKDLSDHELGFSNSKKTWTGTTIRIVNNTHPITLGFPLGDLVITDDTWNMHRADGAVAPGGVNLAEKPNLAGRPALMVVERGALLKDGDPAPARRVRLPWGNLSVDFNTSNAIGLQLMERAVCWAASNNPPACGSANDNAGAAGAASAGSITSAASFGQWFRDVLGVNLSVNYPIVLVNDGAGVYEFLTNAFHPIDGILLGNDGAPHNGNFTYTITAEFTYVQCAGQFVQFAGGGDAWLFVNGNAVMDLGGVLPATTQFVEMDRLGLIDDSVNQVRFFHARRQAAQSGFNLRTNIEFLDHPTVATATWPAD